MSSKFTIEIDDEETDARADVQSRPGPMASAIEETGSALRSNADAVSAAREIQTRYARAYKDLVESEQSVELIPLDEIDITHLQRDRRVVDDAALDELAQSIKDVGLSNPIRVELGDSGFRLIQGSRRLNAFKTLLAETGDERFERIPASVWNESDLALGYRRMVDENLVREDVSYAELALLAKAFAEDERTPANSPSEAVDQLYASVAAAKRSHIRSFVTLLDRAKGLLAFPESLSRNVGLKLSKFLEAEVNFRALEDALAANPARDSTKEQEIVVADLEGAQGIRRGPSARRIQAVKHTIKVDGVSYKVAITPDKLVIAGADLTGVEQSAIESFLASILPKS